MATPALWVHSVNEHQPTADQNLTVSREPPGHTATFDATADVNGPKHSDSPPGSLAVPGYAITGEIAKGGMGRVYAAVDLTLDREVAIKTLLPGANADRFVTESKITAKLPHPNIPPVHELGQLADGTPFLAMKLVRGQTLSALLKARPTPQNDLPRWVQVFEQICQAVGFAHSRGVIHRDLKPLNVMVGQFGEVQVMDWGLARTLASREGERPESDTTPVAHPPGSPDLTQAGAILGTPGYMAPEQARGEPLDARADVFALGATLATILTGKPAFVGSTPVETVRMAGAADLTDVFARLDSCDADADLIALAKRCLSADCGARPADGRAVATEVAAYRAGVEARLHQAETERAEVLIREGEQRKRRRVIAWASGVVIGLLLAGTTVSLWQMFRALTAEGVATANEHRAIAERDAKVVALANEEKSSTELLATLDTVVSEITGDSLATQRVITPEQKKLLAEVLPRYREIASRNGEDEKSRARIARAAFKLGLIEARLGRVGEAVVAFEQAGDQFAALAAEFPAEAEYGVNRAGCRSHLGHMFVAQGEVARAEREYREALALFESLAVEVPATALAVRHELAGGHLNLGAALVDRDPEAAVEQYRKGLALFEALAAEHPDVLAHRLGLATGHVNLGTAFLGLGEADRSEEEYRKGKTLLEKLATDFPAVRDFRHHLALCHRNLGEVFLLRGKPNGAEDEFGRAVALWGKLVTQFPAVPEYRGELGVSHYQFGMVLGGRNPRGAEEQFRKAIDLLDPLAVEHVEVPYFRTQLAATYNSLGDVLVKLGGAKEAEEQFLNGNRIWEKLVAKVPDALDYQTNLGGSYCNLGLVCRDLGRAAEGQAWFDKAVRTLVAAQKHQPQNPTVRLFLRNSYRGRAKTYDQLGQHSAAVGDWDRVIELSPKQQQPSFRVARAVSRAQAGLVTEAVAEAAELRKLPGWQPESLYDLACVYAVASDKIAEEKQNYADRAMEMLNKAVKAGFKDAAKLKADKSLDPIREREDFKKLLAELEKK